MASGIIFLLLCFSTVKAQTIDDSTSVSSSTDDSVDTQRERRLQKFRDAFQEVINKDTTTSADADPGLDLPGFVLDETRTRMGRDFYTLFYQKWNPPKALSSYSITIQEKPAPGLGSLVSILIDYEVIYRTQLEPSYSVIDELSEQAVEQCIAVLKQRVAVEDQLLGY